MLDCRENYRKEGFQMILNIVKGHNCAKANGVSDIQLSGESLAKEMVRITFLKCFEIDM